MSSFPISLKEFTVNEWGGGEDSKCPLCGKHWLRKILLSMFKINCFVH